MFLVLFLSLFFENGIRTVFLETIVFMQRSLLITNAKFPV